MSSSKQRSNEAHALNFLGSLFKGYMEGVKSRRAIEKEEAENKINAVKALADLRSKTNPQTMYDPTGKIPLYTTAASIDKETAAVLENEYNKVLGIGVSAPAPKPPRATTPANPVNRSLASASVAPPQPVAPPVQQKPSYTGSSIEDYTTGLGLAVPPIPTMAPPQPTALPVPTLPPAAPLPEVPLLPPGSKVQKPQPPPKPHLTQLADSVDGAPLFYIVGADGKISFTRSDNKPMAGRPVPIKGNAEAVKSASNLSSLLPQAEALFLELESNGWWERKLSLAPGIGQVAFPETEQAIKAISLVGFTYGGQQLTDTEKEMTLGALIPNVWDSRESIKAKHKAYMAYVTGKADLYEAANLLGPAGNQLKAALEKYRPDADKKPKITLSEEEQIKLIREVMRGEKK